MAKGPLVDYEAARRNALYAAAWMFLKFGYTDTSLRGVAKEAGISLSALLRTFGSKEGLLCALVDYVLDGQFTTAMELVSGVTDDPVLYYAAETTLKLYMAESDESIRDLYGAVYSLPESSELVRRSVTEKMLGRVFRAYLPEASPALLAVFLRLLANLCAVSRSDRLAAQLPELLAFCKAVQLLENRMVAQALSSFLLNASQCCLDWQRGKPASEESTGVSSAIVTVGCDLVDRCGDEVALERAIGAICNMLILNPFVGVGRGFYEELPRCG